MKVWCICGLMLVLSALHAGAAEYATPESQGISSSAILSWIDACEENLDCMHGFVIRRNGKIIAEGSWKPFETLDNPHILYSHSKSFTSTAIGFLADERKLDLDERVADIFPDDLPTEKSARLLSLRVRDLLTMNMGAKDHQLTAGGDWVKLTLAKELTVDPGTFYRYDSDATYLLAAIVEKKSGVKMMDYLRGRLFEPLGFGRVWTSFSPQGIPCGGWGMQMNTRDLSKFGQLYLDEGMWKGRRILSREWVRLASARQTASGWGGPDQPESDWYQGYGFQFWRCRHNAYRADGADGQVTLVMPEQNAVVSIHASLGDMGKELDLIWRHLLAAMKDSALPEDPAAAAKLAGRCAALTLKTPGASAAGIGKFFGRYSFADNRRGLKSMELSRDGDTPVCTLETRAGAWKIPLGVGEWKKGKVKIDPETYEALGKTVGMQEVFSAAAVQSDGTLRLRIHFANTTLRLDLTSADEGGARVLAGRLSGLGGTELKAVMPGAGGDGQ